uniref:Nanos-type domain-containing protein n=1 Tax=viral metagenome TaxID=1070528 RepID=A0A6C0JX31_9ZZZZ
MSSITKPNGCGYCRNISGVNWQSHQRIDSEGIVICPVIIAKESCRYCKERGHFIPDCPKLAEKKKREEDRVTKIEKNFPPLFKTLPTVPTAPGAGAGASRVPTISYAQKIAENRPAKLTAALEKEFEDRKVAEVQAKQKKAEDWRKEQEERKQQEEERKKRREAAHVQAMYDKWGTNWHNCVYMTDEDCNTAYEMRERDENEYYRMEEETEKYCKEQQELRERLKREMTPEEYQEWEWEQDDEYFDAGVRMQTEFECRASRAAVSYFNKHGLMLPDGDFVSSEWGAERKLDKVRREKAQKK